MAWSGYVLWMVLDKFGHKTRSYVTKRKEGMDGTYANSGKRSGSKIYLTIMQIMLSKGMNKLLHKYIEDNASGTDKVQKYIHCLSS